MVIRTRMGQPSDNGARSRVPSVVMAIFLFLLLGMGYYALSFSWENKNLLDKYTATMWEIKKLSKSNVKLDRNLKMCENREQSTEASNTDLQRSVKRKESEIATIAQDRDGINQKLSQCHQFYSEIRDILEKTDDVEFPDPGDGIDLEKSYSELRMLLTQWKADRSAHEAKNIEHDQLKKDYDALHSQFNDIQQRVAQLQNTNTQLQHDSQQDKHEAERLNTEIENLKREQSLRGFRRKNKTSFDTNVSMLDLNQETHPESKDVNPAVTTEEKKEGGQPRTKEIEVAKEEKEAETHPETKQTEVVNEKKNEETHSEDSSDENKKTADATTGTPAEGHDIGNKEQGTESETDDKSEHSAAVKAVKKEEAEEESNEVAEHNLKHEEKPTESNEVGEKEDKEDEGKSHQSSEKTAQKNEVTFDEVKKQGPPGQKDDIDYRGL